MGAKTGLLELHQSRVLRPTVMVSTTWLATSGNGAGIGTGLTITRFWPRKVASRIIHKVRIHLSTQPSPAKRSAFTAAVRFFATISIARAISLGRGGKAK